MFSTLVVMSTHYYMGVLGGNQSILLIKVLKKKRWVGTSRFILLAPNLQNANYHPYNHIADNI